MVYDCTQWREACKIHSRAVADIVQVGLNGQKIRRGLDRQETRAWHSDADGAVEELQERCDAFDGEEDVDHDVDGAADCWSVSHDKCSATRGSALLFSDTANATAKAPLNDAVTVHRLIRARRGQTHLDGSAGSSLQLQDV